MNYWLMKTEPSVYSFGNLVQSEKRTTSWEGVRNYQARNFMRDAFKIKDQVLIYHSGIESPSIVGIAEVVKEGYPDLTAHDPKSRYYDPSAKKNNPWVMVDVRALAQFEKPIFLETLRRYPDLKKMVLLQKGCRLSVQPVEEEDFRFILSLEKHIILTR